MRVIFHKTFLKQYRKFPEKIKIKFDTRLSLLLKDFGHPTLRVHPLRGDKFPLFSMNVTGDYRALFVRKEDEVRFHEIGKHSELYD